MAGRSRLLTLLSLLLPFLLSFSATDGASLPARARRFRRALIEKDSNRWPNGVVPYEIYVTMTDYERANLTAAMNAWSRETCITFREKQPSDRNWIRVVDGNRCHSLVGRHPDPGAQDLILERMCRMYGVILHELGHALGLLHEHNRPDRDGHIHVDSGRAFNRKEEPNEVLTYETPYDLQSIMHYGVKEFPNNEVPRVKDASKKDTVGNVYHKELSFFDVRAINLHYRCNAHCEQQNCPGSAFQNKTCQCEGPEDYADRQCFNVRGDDDCNKRADVGECDLNPVDMRVHCRKACNTCFKHAGHGVHEREKVCKDHNAGCSAWASTNECTKNPDYMKITCPRSCRECTPTASQLNKERAAAAAAAASTTARPCFNRRSDTDCAFWKRQGNCRKVRFRRFMRNNCYKTCSGCVDANAPTTTPRPCVNDASDTDCASWQRQGYCHEHQYHEWMRSKCYRTCRYCTVPTTTAGPTTAPPLGEPACTDSNEGCPGWARTGECDANAAWMRSNCRLSCRVCQPSNAAQPCVDSNENCPAWASSGECAVNRNYMSRNCKRSCNICRK